MYRLYPLRATYHQLCRAHSVRPGLPCARSSARVSESRGKSIKNGSVAMKSMEPFLERFEPERGLSWVGQAFQPRAGMAGRNVHGDTVHAQKRDPMKVAVELYEKKQLAIQAAQRLKEDRELAECSFQPALSRKSLLILEKKPDIRVPLGVPLASHSDHLGETAEPAEDPALVPAGIPEINYTSRVLVAMRGDNRPVQDRNMEWWEEKNARLKAKQQEKLAREDKQMTFSPKICRNSEKMVKAMYGDANAVERLSNGYARSRQKKEQAQREAEEREASTRQRPSQRPGQRPPTAGGVSAPLPPKSSTPSTPRSITRGDHQAARRTVSRSPPRRRAVAGSIPGMPSPSTPERETRRAAESVSPPTLQAAADAKWQARFPCVLYPALLLQILRRAAPEWFLKAGCQGAGTHGGAWET